MFHSNIMARLLRAVCSMPVLVCTAHNSNEGGWLSMAMYRATNRLGDVLTNVSGLAARELERRGAAPKGTIVTVWNGIDTVRFAPDSGSRKFLRDQMAVKEDAFVFLAAGRLAAQKAYPDLLHALRIALQRNPRIQLVVAGEGELAEDLRGLASSLGIGDRVTWLGVRDDIDCLMKAADAFVLSSEYEGFGLVVAEAMSSALPVVATCCNGPEEVIGEEGLLVPVRNPGALADAMARVAGMSVQERAHIGNSARTRVVERFSLAAAARNWIDLYRAQGAAPW
jgi:glycosyltransferase involved in cell wall biosynthesis